MVIGEGVEKFPEEGRKKGFTKIIMNSELVGGPGPGSSGPEVEKDVDSLVVLSDSMSARIDEDLRAQFMCCFGVERAGADKILKSAG
ncbi:hypothetical protein V6N13_129118 [Hibiscus sabdariffa]